MKFKKFFSFLLSVYLLAFTLIWVTNLVVNIRLLIIVFVVSTPIVYLFAWLTSMLFSVDDYVTFKRKVKNKYLRRLGA